VYTYNHNAVALCWWYCTFSNIKVLNFSHLVYFQNTNLAQGFGDIFWLPSGKNGWGMSIHLGPTIRVTLNCWVRGKILRLETTLGPKSVKFSSRSFLPESALFFFINSGLWTTLGKLNDPELMI